MSNTMKLVCILFLHFGFLFGCLASLCLNDVAATIDLIAGATIIVAFMAVVLRYQARRSHLLRSGRYEQHLNVQAFHGRRQVRLKQRPSTRQEAHQKASA